MAGVRMELEGADEALAALGLIVARIDHPRPLYDELGRMLTTSTGQRFEDEEDPEGNPWPKSIRALLDGGKTLTDSTALRGSITWEASDTGVSVGTNVIYAAIHQLGGIITAKTSAGLHFQIGGVWVTKASVTMPARAFLGVSDADETEILNIAGEWLLEPVGGADENTPVSPGGIDA